MLDLNINEFIIATISILFLWIVIVLTKIQRHWASNEYFYMSHIRSFRLRGEPMPGGWVGSGWVQQNYPSNLFPGAV